MMLSESGTNPVPATPFPATPFPAGTVPFAPATAARGSSFASAVAACRAIEAMLPVIVPALRDRSVSGTGFLCIVVMDPGLQPGDCSFDEAVLLEHAIGDRREWDADYAGFARAKAALSWRLGHDGHAVQSSRAHRLREGDSLLWGGVCLEGITVGVSGAQPWWDEAFATCIAAHLRASAKAAHADARQAGALVAPAAGQNG
ncbi:hypothetical protein [Rhizobacter sp. OV335]|uniref:hypothetical protein n=1 Tax=Rhizobacter sp. OV335 TaxID=1500264 RepID=UPI00092197DC|nr:hypothetical protein [Rhizobacter sp. OV335]SHM50586.1 hypothetical protein SAMN02787076_01429 [Rhizobacter sp. OV335]